ncbi:S41 family peptidase [Algihabitans albus]|uniref:S41 family peptidase n=1 Tax=Algihabitans albus TaxID=2164067 RepID=UPI0013C3654A|nr:S41 family peptidase [Algihabitans albus]
MSFRHLAISLAVAGIALGACTTQELRSQPTAYEPSRAERMFIAGYQDVTAVYIEDVEVDDLALAGLEAVTQIDPELSFDFENGKVTVAYDEAVLRSLPAPSPRDSTGWARLTASAIEEGRRLSPALGESRAEDVYEAVFDGMVAELDAYSRYAGREEARENRASRDGFGGIGVRIRVEDDGVRLVSVMEETPAEAAGLQDEDLIVTIAGRPAAGMDQRDVVRTLRGPIGTYVRVSVRRADLPEPFEVDIERDHIVPQTVTYRRADDVAVIRVAGFNQSTTQTLREKIFRAEREIGEDLQGFIIDLRDNPGGLLDQAVSVADLFVADGRIVSTHGRHPDSHQYFEARRDDLIGQLPIVVLINGNSASASEIVAAALQDSRKAIVVGSNSFGKGTVQTVLRLPNEGELTLTWARFHAPSGYALHKRGVLPDVCIADDSRDLPATLTRLRGGELLIPSRQRQAPVDIDDEDGLQQLRALCPTRDSEGELDVEVALQLILDPSLYASAIGSPVNTAGRVKEAARFD